MQVKHRKCGVLHGKRSGNRWCRRDQTGDAQLTIQHEALPMFNQNQVYTYLGHSFNISNNSSLQQASDVVMDFKSTMDKIDAAPLPLVAKLQAINIMACSKLNFFFPNLTFSVKKIKEMEDYIVRHVRGWLKLNKSSTRSFMFSPRHEGALGILNPSAMYSAKHLSFRLSVLNSDDQTVRHIARSSLSLHMTKRKVPQASGANSFAGFQITPQGNLAKNSKVTWPRSDWVHLNDLCVREGVTLEKRLIDDCFALTFSVEDDVFVSVTEAKAAYHMCKQAHLSHFISEWKLKAWQGRIVREATEIDHKLSNSFLNNVNLKNSIISFVIRGRLQLLQCNSLMALYYPKECTRRCSLCNHPTETVSHILNGCKFQAIYQARHNRLVDLVATHIPDIDCSAKIINDTCLTPHMFDADTTNFLTSAKRPDITIINRSTREVFLVAIAVPFDAFIDTCYITKFDKYMPLCLEINSLGYTCRTVVLIFGSLGNVPQKVIPGLKLIGVRPFHTQASGWPGT
jgi:hypothetical protein